jgi:hypothetical protein
MLSEAPTKAWASPSIPLSEGGEAQMAAGTAFRLGGSYAGWLDLMVATALAIRDLPDVEIVSYDVRGPAEGIICIRVHRTERKVR